MARSKARKTADLGNGIATADLTADSVDSTKIADDAIDSEHYVDGSIDTAHIADNAVTAAKLAAGAAVPSQTGQSGKYLTTDGTNASWGTITQETASSILTKVKTVDGAGSGLDADTLDGNQATAFATAAQGALADSATQPADNISTLTNDSGFITGNQTITLSGDVSGSGTTAITVTVADDSHNHVISNVDGLQTALDAKQGLDADLTAIAALANTDGNFIVGNGTTWVAESGAIARTSLGLGSLATLSTVNASTITDNSVGAAELNVTGNGTTTQYLRSDGDGTFTWATPPDTNTTYSVGNGGLTEINFTSALNTKLSGIETGATADQSASEILTAIKTVDGSGSGLDADTVDGIQGANFLRSDTSDTMNGTLSFVDNAKAQFGASNDLQIFHDGSNSFVWDTGTGNLVLRGAEDIRLDSTNGDAYIVCNSNNNVQLYYDNAEKLATTSTGVSVTGTCAATSFTGDGSALTGIASTVASGCIYENSQTITSNYTMTTNKNGHSAGPITINTGVTVTIPTGSNWVVS